MHIQDFSTNGTYLNRKRLPKPPYKSPKDARVRVCHGDEVTFEAPTQRGSSAGVVVGEEKGFIVNLLNLDG